MFRYSDPTSVQVELHMTELRRDARQGRLRTAGHPGRDVRRGRHARRRSHRVASALR